MELASVIWMFELLALPAVGATPPLSRWPRDQVALDAVNDLVYAAGALTALSCLEPRAARAKGTRSRHAGPSVRASAVHIGPETAWLMQVKPDGSVRSRGRHWTPRTSEGALGNVVGSARSARHAQDL
jgi:hypothetical protein